MRFLLLLSLFLTLMFSNCRNNARPIVSDHIKNAQKLYGLHFSEDKIDTLTAYLNKNLAGYDSMRRYPMNREVFPAILFNPLPADFKMPVGQDHMHYCQDTLINLPENRDSLCYLSITQLSHLLKARKITALELTQLYLARIRKYDPSLKSVITLTEDSALKAARVADQELDLGIIRGPLHGIPYGLKDLIAIEGHPTTWGAKPYQDQTIDYSATVAQKLKDAGAILIAKLSSGALARGDIWFGGQTVSPWDTLMGASGSSAGSASATAAGLVAFSIGTETMGSITMPSARNGVTGLRPTYGMVSRYGTMTLSWSMDKIGPICRSVQDCAIVFTVIKGVDSLDATTYEAPFLFDCSRSLTEFKVGILHEAIEADTSRGADNLKTMLSLIDSVGIQTIEKKLPINFPFKVFDIILRSESGAFFDDFVRSDAVDDLGQQNKASRANSLRQSRFIPAVEYIQANRHRTILIQQMNDLMRDIDVLIAPPSAKNQLLITNLTGQPALSIPTGLDSLNHPTSVTLIGKLFEEGKILEFGHALQRETNFHEMVPPLFHSAR